MFREACPEQSRRAQFATGRIRRGGHERIISKTNQIKFLRVQRSSRLVGYG